MIAMTKFDGHFKHLQLLTSLYSGRFQLFAQPFPLLGYKTAFGATLAGLHAAATDKRLYGREPRALWHSVNASAGRNAKTEERSREAGVSSLFAFASLSLALWGRTKRDGPAVLRHGGTERGESGVYQVVSSSSAFHVNGRLCARYERDCADSCLKQRRMNGKMWDA